MTISRPLSLESGGEWMHQTLRAFELIEPATIPQAVDVLQSYEGDASVLAGGVDLIAKMRHWQLAPQCLVSLRGIPGLERLIVNQGGELEIGPMASLRSVESLAAVQKGWPVLHESVRQIASVQIKTMGTLVGNLCVATPASDVAIALYVLDACLTLAGPQGEIGRASCRERV
jgi:CO/xanthine dehydrogenase FAD-binding subunit